MKISRKFLAAAIAPMLPGLVGFAWYAYAEPRNNPGGVVMIATYVLFLALGQPFVGWREKKNDRRAMPLIVFGAAVGFCFLVGAIAVLFPSALMDVRFWSMSASGFVVSALSGALVMLAYWFLAVRAGNKEVVAPA